jgi:3-phosphoshikimate 1-carboxyvinyltransferase
MNDSAQRRVVAPAVNLEGSLALPGDKSLSHRYAMLAALAEGRSRFTNFSAAADCASSLDCLRRLGVRISREGDRVEISGGPWTPPSEPLDCGNSGSTMRMLAGLLAGQPFACQMTGDDSLRRRPMARIFDPLRRMGAAIEGSEGDRPPLRIAGCALRAIDYTLPIASAQVKSCVLFAGLLAQGTTSVEEPVRTRDHSELALGAFGATLERQGNRVRIEGGQHLRALEAEVPGDISSAAFFFCAAALFPGSNLIVDNLLLNPTRAAILDILAQLGLEIRFLRVAKQHGELVGSVQVRGGQLRGCAIRGATTASLIDELPVLAAIAPYTDSGVVITDARELRVKESDRIAAIVSNLRAMGASVEEKEDGMSIPGEQRLHGATVNSYADHRIAMAFSVAALRASGETIIEGADCAAVSYPAYFDTLQQLLRR